MRLRRLRLPIAARILARLRDLLDGYRPEAHFMRGPGPRCAARARAGGVRT